MSASCRRANEETRARLCVCARDIMMFPYSLVEPVDVDWYDTMKRIFSNDIKYQLLIIQIHYLMTGQKFPPENEFEMSSLEGH